MVMNNTDAYSQVLKHLMRHTFLVTGPVTHSNLLSWRLAFLFPSRGMILQDSV